LSDVVAFTGHDLPFTVAAEIPGQRQPDPAGRAVDDGARVADRVVLVIGDDEQLRPGLPAVGAPLEHDVDVAAVAAAPHSPLA